MQALLDEKTLLTKKITQKILHDTMKHKTGKKIMLGAGLIAGLTLANATVNNSFFSFQTHAQEEKPHTVLDPRHITQAPDGTYLRVAALGDEEKGIEGVLSAFERNQLKPLYSSVDFEQEGEIKTLYRILVPVDTCSIAPVAQTLNNLRSKTKTSIPALSTYAKGRETILDLKHSTAYDAQDAKRYESLPYFSIFNKYAQRNNISVSLAYTVAMQESRLNPNATNPSGAKGIMQLMPEAQAEHKVTNPYDAEQNIRAGIEHLREVSDMFHDDIELTLAGYNAGHNGIARRKGCTLEEKFANMKPTAYKETRAFVPIIANTVHDLTRQEGRITLTRLQQTRDTYAIAYK